MARDRKRNWRLRRGSLVRAVAWLLIVLFAISCTRVVSREPLQTRRYRLDLERLGPQRLSREGLAYEGVVLTPAQWPLEASIKGLFAGDFTGVIENFDLRFHSATLRGDALERLLAKGFLPAYIRVRNTGDSDTYFQSELLSVRVDEETVFLPYPASQLPRRFREIDWERTGLNIVMAALLVVLVVVAAKEGRGGVGRFRIRATNLAVDVGDRSYRSRGTEFRGTARRANGAVGAGNSNEKGLLQSGVLRPGEAREGFLFFELDSDVVDWTTARLALLP